MTPIQLGLTAAIVINYIIATFSTGKNQTNQLLHSWLTIGACAAILIFNK